MRVDVWQVMPFAEFGQPSGNAVRMHGTAIVPGKHETSSLPAVTVELTKLFLCFLMLTQQIDRFCRDRDKSRFPGFGCFFVDTACFGVRCSV